MRATSASVSASLSAACAGVLEKTRVTLDSMESNNSLACVPERELLERFAALVRRDRTNTAHLLAHIAEIDERKLWAKQACSSMFAFCMERFHMSESMAAKRIWAARTARRFPVILPMLAKGELHLSGINQLGKHLTEANHRALLERVKHKSSREIDVLVAELAPRPDVPSRVRALPIRAVTSTGNTREGHADGQRVADCLPVEPLVADAPEHAPEVPEATPEPVTGPFKPAAGHKQIVALAPKRYKIEITVDQDTHDKLRTLQDLLRHQLPSADPATIVSRAIALLLDDTLKRKAALTKAARPSREPSATRTRAIPAAIRREVWRRDRGRCAFLDERGRRCPATSSIEYHHETPYGRGGPHEAANVALRCRAHNQYEADLDFGRAFMRSKRCGFTFRAER